MKHFQNFKPEITSTRFNDGHVPPSHSLDRNRPLQLDFQTELYPQEKYRYGQNPLTVRNLQTFSKVQLRNQNKGLEVTTSRKKPQRERLITQLIVEQQCQEDPGLLMELHQLREERQELIRRLIQAQNNQKNMYFAIDMERKRRQNSLSDLSPQIERKPQQNEKYNQIQVELTEQRRENMDLRLQLQKKIDENVNQKQVHQNSIFDFRKQIADFQSLQKIKEEKAEALKKTIEEKEKLIEMIRSQKESIKNVNTTIIGSLTAQLQKSTNENKNMVASLQESNSQRIKAESALLSIKQENEKLMQTVSNLNREMDNRLKDLEFLNNQSYTLDQSLSHAMGQIGFLKQNLAEKEKSSMSAKEIIVHKDTINTQKIKIQILEGNIEKLTFTLFQLKTNYEKLLQKCQEMDVENDRLEKKTDQIDDLKNHLTSIIDNYSLSKAPQKQNVSGELKTSSQEQFLKGENERLKQALEGVQTNQKILLRELDWLKKEKDDSISQVQSFYKQQIQVDHHQKETLKNQYQLKIKEYEDQLQMMQKQLSASQSSKINESDLSLNLLQSENQSLREKLDSEQKEKQKMKQELQGLRRQIEGCRLNYDKQLELLQKRFQFQLSAKNEEYNNLLSEYSSQILKNSKDTTFLPRQLYSQHHAETNMNKLLKLDKQASQDEFVSPPSSAVVKSSNGEEKGVQAMIEQL